ncbi:MAG: hypothetical protein IJY71_08475 [Clostridia bacterium]|nr:hypothetical protein [Clostridia bacterium]
MKKFILIVALLLVCINLTSCELLSILSYSISGDIMEPYGDFSRGSEKNTLVFGGNTYILIEEVNGYFEFFITDEDLLLGQRSNFPFFPNGMYYANAKENADYIACGNNSGIMSCVYLREDLYKEPLCYVLQDTDYEFDFSSAFIETEEVSYREHIEGREYYGRRIQLYVRDFPRLTVYLHLCKIHEKWYYVEHDEAFALSDAFLNVLLENNILT